MRRPRIGRVLLDCFSLSLCTSTCVCVRALEDAEEEAVQRAALVTASDHHRQLRLKDLVDGAGTLGFHLQPKVRAYGHCSACMVAPPFLLPVPPIDALHHTLSVCLMCSLFPTDRWSCCMILMIDADGGAEGVHALQRLRQEGPQAHLQDGRYTHLSIAIFHWIGLPLQCKSVCIDSYASQTDL